MERESCRVPMMEQCASGRRAPAELWLPCQVATDVFMVSPLVPTVSKSQQRPRTGSRDSGTPTRANHHQSCADTPMQSIASNLARTASASSPVRATAQQEYGTSRPTALSLFSGDMMATFLERLSAPMESRSSLRDGT